MRRAMLLPTPILSLCLGLGTLLDPVRGKVACTETSTCESALRPGSVCTNGYCTNPFAKGCLNNFMGRDRDGRESYPKVRTCNSDDGPDALERGLCAASPLGYEEVRLGPNNWESAMFYGWILQILLSEVLDVPATIDTGPGGGALSFYDVENSFNYPKKANNFDALYKANEVGDCRNSGGESCAHLLTEVWQGKRELNESAVEREGNGMVGHVGWYIPKFAAKKEASLAHYLGLAGEENRQKLADTFKRPLRWIDYCETVSANNCTNSTGDDLATAARPPEDDAEVGKYFVKGLYTGHFVATERNDCSDGKNCTGHMIDYPCTWSAYTAAQLHWHGIFLESDTPDGTNTYKYGAMLEIIAASKATRSPIIIVWWYPDPTLDRDFVRVSLPEATRECLENRPEAKPDRCDASREVLLGKEVGACGYNTHSFEKYFARTFRERSVEMPLAKRSPGQQFARNTRISDIDLSEMMVHWSNRGVDKWNYDPREAVCSWVANNLNDGLKLKNFLPPGYPRKIQNESGYNTLMYFSIAFGCLGALVAAAVGAATYRFRDEKQIKFAQDLFLYLFSLGFFLICISGILYGTMPSKATCAARWWFVVIGFTFALVPLLIKVAAINKLMNDAKKMRRTRVTKEYVHKVVAAVVLVVVVYMSVWTELDPPSPKRELALRSESGDIVDEHVECASKHVAFEILAFSWEGSLVCFAAAVAFLSRKIPQAFNESRVVGNMAYLVFFFLVIRLLVYFLPASVLQPSLRNGITGILLTLESLATISLYFGPKFFSIYKGEDDGGSGAAASWGSVSGISTLTSKNDPMCPLCGKLKESSKPKQGNVQSFHEVPKNICATNTTAVSSLGFSATDQMEEFGKKRETKVSFAYPASEVVADDNESLVDMKKTPSKLVEVESIAKFDVSPDSARTVNDNAEATTEAEEIQDDLSVESAGLLGGSELDLPEGGNGENLEIMKDIESGPAINGECVAEANCIPQDEARPTIDTVGKGAETEEEPIKAVERTIAVKKARIAQIQSPSRGTSFDRSTASPRSKNNSDQQR